MAGLYPWLSADPWPSSRPRQTCDLDDLAAHLQVGPKQVILLDDCHLLFLCRPGGFAPLDRLLRLMRTTGRHILWITTWNVYSWIYLENLRSVSDHLAMVHTISPRSPAEIQRMLLDVLRQINLEVTWSEDETEAIFRSIWTHARGRPMLAQHILLRSLYPTEDGKLTLRADKMYRLPQQCTVKVGDYIEVGSHAGEVVSIGLRSTTIVSLEDNTITVPNAAFLTETVSNANAGNLSCMVVTDFYLAHDAIYDEVKTILWEAAATSKFVAVDRPVVVVSHELPFGTRFSIKAYVADHRHMVQFASDVAESAKYEFRQRNIPYAHVSYADAIYQPLIRAYIGQGLRADLARLDGNRTLSDFVESLRKHGVEDEVISSAIAEVQDTIL